MDRAGTLTFLGSWGILRCGLCSSGMTVANSEGSYVCNLRRSVGHVPRHTARIYMRDADAIVAGRVWTRLSALDPEDDDDVALLAAAAERFAVQGTDPEAAAELAEQEAQLDHVQRSMKELYQDRQDGLYEGATGRQAFKDTILKYQQHEARCLARIDELKAAATTATRLPIDEWFSESEDGNPFAPGGLWERWDVETKRSFVSLFVDSVTVAPATTKRGKRLERADERIEIKWATLTEVDDDNESVTA
jgi:site-specific DNA recombinase